MPRHAAQAWRRMSPALSDESKWRVLPDDVNNKGGPGRFFEQAIKAKKELQQAAFDRNAGRFSLSVYRHETRDEAWLSEMMGKRARNEPRFSFRSNRNEPKTTGHKPGRD